jgi:hypothetical protein
MNSPLSRCRIAGAPRSTIYHRRALGERLGVCPNPATAAYDTELKEAIRWVIIDCPFAGEGDRKVRARLRRAIRSWWERSGCSG